MKFKGILICLFLTLFLTLPLSSPSIPQTRDATKVYKVAVLPFLIHSQENLDYLREGIYDILMSRITQEGRIVVIERSQVERALYEERPMRLDEAAATKIGTRVGADYIVLGSLTKIGNYISLDARLISITEEKPPLGVYTQHKGIDDVMVKIGEFAQDIGYKILGRRATAGRPTGPRSAFIQREERIGRIGPEGVGYKKSQSFNFEIKGLDIGDVDGDKKNEVVVMDPHNLYIFKYDGEKLNLFQKIEIGYQHNFLSLDVRDINRNGFAEIIVTSVVEDNLQSFILEFEQGKFRKINEKAGWYLRVLEHPKDGPILMGQKMGSDGVFIGSIYQFVWKKKSFERGPKMPFPKETILFGLTMADLRGDGKIHTILFDQLERLIVLSPDGKQLWKSSERYGGTNNFYETTKKKPEAYRPVDAPPFRVYIPGRILVKDLDGDGIPEIIVNKNEFKTGTLFEKLRSYEKGEILNLVWEENGLVTNWKTKDIKGYIADYQIRDAENIGEDELIVAVVGYEKEGTGIFSKDRSNILFFKLN
ncbi:MAG: VCBS repeat-containing protein [Syntrophaceae bacterium]|nr:VCBS repeat-containing protein [Syntrophaceae bacterium]